MDAMEPTFPYREFREGQREIAEAVADAASKGSILAVNAPTGFGKTAAVVYGHLLAGSEKVLYLVRTVNEVEPVARELRRFREPFVVLISPRRTCPLLRGNDRVPPEDFWENCRIARLRGACPYYEAVDSIDYNSITGLMLSSPTTLSGLRSIASRLGACPFFASRHVIDSARFIVATYPYFFKKDLFDYIFGEAGIGYQDLHVVVDEAHAVLNIHSITERSLTIDVIDRGIKEVEVRVPEYMEAAARLRDLKRLLEDLARSRVRGMRLIDKSIVEEALGDYNIILDAAEESRFRAASEALGTGDPSQLVRIRSPLHSIALWIESFLHEEARIFYTSEWKPSLVATLMDPALVASTPLESVRSAVLVSGTLPPHGFISSVLGISREVIYMDIGLHVKGHGKRAYTAVAADVSTRFVERSKLMYSRIASYINMINSRLPGPKLVVYPSYEVMAGIIDKLPAGTRMVTEDRHTSIDDVVDSIDPGDRMLINAVAGGKLVEGVEFTVDGRSIVQVVVVVGVPFPQPDDYTRELVEVLSSRLGGSGAREYLYRYLTIVKVRQALGRAVRGPGDRAVFFLLDYRYLRKDLKRLLGLGYDRVFKGIYGIAAALKEALRHLESSTPPPA